ncbi:helix-turn-helix transcriptional regulator [Rhodobacter sp. SY28-1]|uniref:ArsR/SmtB family transcription factor n=1 Tax=Rhodobacter sp. SY28-1 TaxID=2562317 RepID=UPI0010C0834B|nr:metalloregulator ArsR/SmtB family transcription factor [Rhodobacter sp. SY28-1]
MSLDRSDSAALDGGRDFATGLHDGGRSLATALADHAEPAAALMKALSHEGRLLILCHLAEGEKSVSELEALIGQRQAAVSQQLARLRLEGLVTTRRAGKAIYYAIRDQRTVGLLSCLPKLFSEAA